MRFAGTLDIVLVKLRRSRVASPPSHFLNAQMQPVEGVGGLNIPGLEAFVCALLVISKVFIGQSNRGVFL